MPHFGHALRFWLLLRCISFGGPAGQIAIMHGELVDKRRWIDEHAFQRGLNFSVRRALRVTGACLLLWWLPIVLIGAWLGTDSTALAMGTFFSKTALVMLGGAYAVLPYVADRAVEGYGWLSPEQTMTGLGLAETTPGPLILVLEFVGFAGAWQHPDLGSPQPSALLGAGVTLWATFLPSFLFVLAAVTAAVAGVIAHLALWFGGGCWLRRTVEVWRWPWPSRQ